MCDTRGDERTAPPVCVCVYTSDDEGEGGPWEREEWKWDRPRTNRRDGVVVPRVLGPQKIGRGGWLVVKGKTIRRVLWNRAKSP